MNDAIKQYEDKGTDSSNEMKLSLYFGTWEIAYVVSRQLGYNHTEFPQFASQLLFQLDRQDENGYFVSVQYNKQSLILGGACKNAPDCAFNDFLSLLNSVRANDADMTGCAPKKPVSFISGLTATNVLNSSYLIYYLSAYALLSSIVAICVGYKIMMRNSKRRIFVNSSDPEALLE